MHAKKTQTYSHKSHMYVQDMLTVTPWGPMDNEGNIVHPEEVSHAFGDDPDGHTYEQLRTQTQNAYKEFAGEEDDPAMQKRTMNDLRVSMRQWLMSPQVCLCVMHTYMHTCIQWMTWESGLFVRDACIHAHMHSMNDLRVSMRQWLMSPQVCLCVMHTYMHTCIQWMT